MLDLQRGECIFTLHGHLGPVTTATLGGPTVGGGEGATGHAVLNMGSHKDQASLEGAIIASGAQDGSLCVWDVATGACVYR